MMSQGHCCCSRAPGLQNQKIAWTQGAPGGTGTRRGPLARLCCPSRTSEQPQTPLPSPCRQNGRAGLVFRLSAAAVPAGAPRHAGASAGTGPLRRHLHRNRDTTARQPARSRRDWFCAVLRTERVLFLAAPELKISLRIYLAQFYFFLEI